MKEIVIFTAPKPFKDAHINMIQRNAISSWRDLGADAEVFIVGEEAGTEQAAKELGVGYLPDVERNEQGTPLVSSIFDVVRSASEAPLMAYVNADIILLPETLSVLRDIDALAASYAVMGQRYDLEITEPLDFAGDWPAALRAMLKENGRLHPPGGSDYFVFPRHLYMDIPNFAIGRAGWDNWMIYHAVSSPWIAIDASPSLDVIHQQHDYAHLDGGQAHYRAKESAVNTDLAGGMRQLYSLLDIPNDFRGGRIKRKKISLPRIIRSIERRLQPIERTGTGWRWALLRRLRKWRRATTGAS